MYITELRISISHNSFMVAYDPHLEIHNYLNDNSEFFKLNNPSNVFK